MENTIALVHLGGAVALLLWGVHMVRSGVQRAYGAELRRLLERALRHRLGAFLTGLGVTAALQSSTAVGLMVTSFAATGVVALAPALAVMLGANVGTTLIVQALSFDVVALSAPLLIAGVAMFRLGAARTRDLGRAAIGLGLMLVSLAQLTQVIAPYQSSPALRVVLAAVAGDPVVSLMFGALFAWAAHSSVAVVLVVTSLVAGGAATLPAGLALALGANLGTSLNPLLEGLRAGDVSGRRVAIGNLSTRLLGALAALPFLPAIARGLAALEPDPARAVADFHTAFNLAVALVFLPAVGLLARALERLIPDRPAADDPTRPLYLDASALHTPAVALGHATREALRMADTLDAMIADVEAAMTARDRDALSRARGRDDVLDALDRAIARYLATLDADSLGDDEHRRLESILTFALNLESAGDVIERDIVAWLSRRFKRASAWTAEARAPVEEALKAVRGNLRLAAAVFTTGDEGGARELADRKRDFRLREAEAERAQIERLRDGAPTSEAVPTDLMRDIKRLNGHLVAAAAYPVLEAKGALAPSRLRA